ncbi:MAG: hypothetical protein Kow00109_11420 [Acidobacteriota bacterium]
MKQEILDYAVRLLARRAYSTEELRRRLLRRGAEPRLVDDTIRRLRRLGYLDDRTFALNRATYRRTVEFWSDRRIEFELRRLGVDAKMMRLALAQANQELSEPEALKQVVARWLRVHGEPASWKQLKRLFDHCIRAGYPPGQVRHELAAWFERLAPGNSDA